MFKVEAKRESEQYQSTYKQKGELSLEKFDKMSYHQLQDYVYSKPNDQFSTKELESISRSIWILGKDYKNEALYHVITTEIGFRYSRSSSRWSLFVSILALLVSLAALLLSHPAAGSTG